MCPIGPQLPPSSFKRKLTASHDGEADASDARNPILHRSKHPRRHEARRNDQEISLDEDDDVDEDEQDSFGPSAPPPRPSAPKSPADANSQPRPAPTLSKCIGPSIGPSIPNQDDINLSQSEHDADTAHIAHHRASTRSSSSVGDGGDDDDDDFGPAPPSASAPTRRAAPIGPSLPSDAAPQRDEWMLAPPPSSSTYSERDPTRIRSRKFASRPSAPKPSSSNGTSIWTETPEEKLRRLQNAVLGRADANDAASQPDNRGVSDADKQRNRKVAAAVEAQRGRSLYQEHSEKRKGKSDSLQGIEEEDDPSKRAFDKEKDMKLGTKIGTAQRRELVSKSAGFGGRFKKGSYL